MQPYSERACSQDESWYKKELVKVVHVKKKRVEGIQGLSKGGGIVGVGVGDILG